MSTASPWCSPACATSVTEAACNEDRGGEPHRPCTLRPAANAFAAASPLPPHMQHLAGDMPRDCSTALPHSRFHSRQGLQLMRNTLLFLVAGTCAALLAGCGNGKLVDAQRVAVASMSKQLPAPYRDGL